MASRQQSKQEASIEKRDVMLTASFAMSQEEAPRVELFSGIHPIEQRHFSEDEELWPLLILRMMRRSDLLTLQHPNIMEEIALLWLKHFPEIDGLISQCKDWSCFSDDQFDQFSQVSDLQKEFHHMLVEKSSSDKRSAGKVVWTFPFPASGFWGREVELRAGLSSQLKDRLTLNNYAPGLLYNYLLHRDIPIELVLDPHQFEDLVGMIFE